MNKSFQNGKYSHFKTKTSPLLPRNVSVTLVSQRNKKQNKSFHDGKIAVPKQNSPKNLLPFRSLWSVKGTKNEQKLPKQKKYPISGKSFPKKLLHKKEKKNFPSADYIFFDMPA